MTANFGVNVAWITGKRSIPSPTPDSSSIQRHNAHKEWFYSRDALFGLNTFLRLHTRVQFFVVERLLQYRARENIVHPYRRFHTEIDILRAEANGVLNLDSVSQFESCALKFSVKNC